MPPKQTSEQKAAAAAKQAESRRAIREAQTAEKTQANLDRLDQQKRDLRERALLTPLSRNRASDRLENASVNRA
jgi:hypothetical protein